MLTRLRTLRSLIRPMLRRLPSSSTGGSASTFARISSLSTALRQNDFLFTFTLPMTVTSRPGPALISIEPLPVSTSSIVPSGTVSVSSNVLLSAAAARAGNSSKERMRICSLLVAFMGTFRCWYVLLMPAGRIWIKKKLTNQARRAARAPWTRETPGSACAPGNAASSRKGWSRSCDPGRVPSQAGPHPLR